jgi:hypothetical protein
MDRSAGLPRVLAALTGALLVASTAGAAVVARRDGPAVTETKVLSAGATSEALETEPATAARVSAVPATTAPPVATAAATAEPATGGATTTGTASTADREPAPASVTDAGPACARLPAGLTREDLLGQRWFARRVEGRVGGNTLWIEVLPCDLYDGEGLQRAVHVEGMPVRLDYLVDYGDGTSYVAAPMDLCRMGLPSTMFGRGASKTYATPGTYTVQVHLTLRGCAGAATAPQRITLRAPVDRVAGPRPVPAPELALQTLAP